MNKRNCLWPICQMPPPTGEADGIPGKVAWKAVGKSSVILHWLEPPDPNGLILKYEIKYRRLGEVGSQPPLSHPGPAPPPASQPAVCAARRKPQCFVCPVFDMPKLVGFTWLCCLLETTLLKFGPPHWLAMAPGLTVLPSTSPVQVRQTCFPLRSASAPPMTILQCCLRSSFHPDLSILPTLHHQRKKILGDCASSSLSPLSGSCCS